MKKILILILSISLLTACTPSSNTAEPTNVVIDKNFEILSVDRLDKHFGEIIIIQHKENGNKFVIYSG